jgi:hypothetical protein
LNVLRSDGIRSRTIGSSLSTHERLSFGYVTHRMSFPNALLLSTRTAPVRKSRSCQASCCCA